MGLVEPFAPSSRAIIALLSKVRGDISETVATYSSSSQTKTHTEEAEIKNIPKDES